MLARADTHTDMSESESKYLPVPQSRFRDLTHDVAKGCYAPEDLRRYGEIEDWDTSEIHDMSIAFYCCATFNRDISRWDTSNVTTMNLRLRLQPAHRALGRLPRDGHA